MSVGIPLDKYGAVGYNALNCIGQFVTILSVNKTRKTDGRRCAHFFVDGCGLRPFFVLEEIMNKRVRNIVYAAVIAALYVVLTNLQNVLLPGSATWAIQFRASEALCVLALFTPAAIPGLTIGCFLFNVNYAQALPLDILVGSLATLLAAGGMYLTRRITVKGYPAPAMVMPALFNALLVGWELTVYIGGGFWLNALYVALGELGVLLSLGSLLYYALRSRGLDKRLFG